ncbi:tight adherence protein C [Evansella vedderi]|uniref:Tight adherence protein C n=1 Tax=Evansella vedderi TaxID=38282 RepID=A0ABT9ZZ71_9BACI|nr:type II secretion system F family protein [Evansella vedderi]MDQ0255743.1 tight adherence protein C [Evansella vedderi]
MLSLLLFLSASIFFTLLTMIILSSLFKRKLQLEKRVNALVVNSDNEVEKDTQKEEEKQLKTQENKLSLFLMKWIPEERYQDLDKKLGSAGRPFQMQVPNLIFIQLILGIGLFLFVLLLYLPNAERAFNVIFFAIVLGVIGAYFPIYFLQSKRKQRMAEIQRMMPDFFDMLNLSVEAGLGLDAALKKIANQVKGPLSEEFLQMLDDVKLGKTKKQAMYDLRDRVPLESFQSMINAIIQADSMGIGMTKVLRAQTVRMRESMRQASKEQAMKAPVKMLLPMVFFIFPTLFIVLLGPVVIRLITELL